MHALSSFAPSTSAGKALPVTDDDISNAFSEFEPCDPENRADSGVQTAIVDMGMESMDPRGAGAGGAPSYRSPSIPPRTISLAPGILADCDSGRERQPVLVQRRPPEGWDWQSGWVIGAVAAGISFVLGIAIVYVVQESEAEDDVMSQPAPADEPSAVKGLPGLSDTHPRSAVGKSGDIAGIPVALPAAASGISDDDGETVEIRLVGLPEGAKVYLNGAPAEHPIRVKRSEESVKIEARAPGYGKVVRRIVPGVDKTVFIRMTPGGN